MNSDVVEIDINVIKVMVSRARPREGFDELKASIKAHGVKQPVQVRDISEWPAKNRRRDDGGLYRYELVCGEGRIAAVCELGWTKIPATVINVPEVEVVGRFLAENLIREDLPVYEKARLIADDLASEDVKTVAKRYFITPEHAQRLANAYSKTKENADDVKALPLRTVEELATLPAGDQRIVLDTLRETGDRQIKALIRRARDERAKGRVPSVEALKKGMERINDELQRVREALKPVRLHHALGVENMVTLLASRKFRKALADTGANIRKFEEAMVRL